jgi:hypothetical protein
LEQAPKAPVLPAVEQAQQPSLLLGVNVEKIENAVLAQKEALGTIALRANVQYASFGVDIADTRRTSFLIPFGLGALLFEAPFSGPVVAAQHGKSAPETNRREFSGTEIGALDPVCNPGREHVGPQ